MENRRSVRAVTVFRLQLDKIWHLGGKSGSRDLQFQVGNKLIWYLDLGLTIE